MTHVQILQILHNVSIRAQAIKFEEDIPVGYISYRGSLNSKDIFVLVAYIPRCQQILLCW